MNLAPASLRSRTNRGHWTQQDVLCVKPMHKEHYCFGAAPVFPGQAHFRDHSCSRKSSRFLALELLPPTTVFSQAQEPWIRFAWPHVSSWAASPWPCKAWSYMQTKYSAEALGLWGFGAGAFHFPEFP